LEGYKIRDQSRPHFLTITVVDWIDVFSKEIYRKCVMDCFDFCIKNKGMVLYGYVIMSNHVHMIVQSNDGKLSDLIRDFKKYTAKAILQKIQTEPESRKEWMLQMFKEAARQHRRNKNFQFWLNGNHPEEIYSDQFMWSKLDYIHLNPVRAGIVEKASHYIYSSANNYVNDSGIIKIEKAEYQMENKLNLNNLLKNNLY